MGLGVIALFAGVALHVPILLLNRPKALVPPGLRDEPGALREWAIRLSLKSRFRGDD
jgi:hypothetical protein